MDVLALEHRSSRTGGWLRARRLKLALWIAVVEGLLVVFDVIPNWVALLGGALVLGFYLVAGRQLPYDTGRQASWIAAAAQVFVALVPILLFLVGTLAIIALAVLALVALVALVADRR